MRKGICVWCGHTVYWTDGTWQVAPDDNQVECEHAEVKE
jgi:hypothetical protein